MLQHQIELLSPRLQKADLGQEGDTCALLAAACLHAKAFSGLMGVTKSHQRKQVLASLLEGACTCWLEWRAAKMVWECLVQKRQAGLIGLEALSKMCLAWRPS